MIIRRPEQVTTQSGFTGASGVTKRVLIGPDENAPTFYLRHFTVDSAGHTPLHRHSWEHEIFVLSGSGSLQVEDERAPLEPGMAAFVPSEALHQLTAGKDGLVFLCLIPAVEEG